MRVIKRKEKDGKKVGVVLGRIGSIVPLALTGIEMNPLTLLEHSIHPF